MLGMRSSGGREGHRRFFYSCIFSVNLIQYIDCERSERDRRYTGHLGRF